MEPSSRLRGLEPRRHRHELLLRASLTARPAALSLFRGSSAAFAAAAAGRRCSRPLLASIAAAA